MPDLSVNRRAAFDYEILETYEAGIELRGFEVKSVKNGHINLAGSFAVVRPVRSKPRRDVGTAAAPDAQRTSNGVSGNEIFLLNATIPAYQPKNAPENYDPQRSRRLLLHKSQIKELIGASSRQGLTIVPLRVYSKKNLVKVLLGLGRSKKKTDKREIIKKRETDREIDRMMKNA